jgi:hypothetical protein
MRWEESRALFRIPIAQWQDLVQRQQFQQVCSRRCLQSPRRLVYELLRQAIQTKVLSLRMKTSSFERSRGPAIFLAASATSGQAAPPRTRDSESRSVSSAEILL